PAAHRGTGRTATAGRPPAVERKPRSPVRCRVCGRTLTDAGEMKLMRCEECPSDMDEALYERLHDWRAGQAALLGQPDYCVFTEKTLMAIAEAVPSTEGELVVIAGVGNRKLSRFGADVLAICAGGTVGDEPEEGADET
ncbi:HRDC domain-containing protein, partial [Streptomyces globisporus]|uniref:HRDC domain-containing protein n=1 Tax=Streptomyces globisporus TaxID=1908 RepID=UPI001980B6AE